MNLEKSNKKKSSVRKIFTSDTKLTNDPKKIMDELESLYANLYDSRSHPLDSATPMFLDVCRGFPALIDDLTGCHKYSGRTVPSSREILLKV